MGRLVCAWCKRVITEPYPTARDSHGICPLCYETWLAQAEQADAVGPTVLLNPRAGSDEAVSEELARVNALRGGTP